MADRSGTLLMPFTLDTVLAGSAVVLSLVALVLAWRSGFANRRLAGELAELRADQNAASDAFKDLAARHAELKTNVDNVAEREDSRPAWRPALDGSHLSRRAQLLQLHQQGNSVNEIAAALRVSPAEVKLMVKAEQYLQRGSQAAPAPALKERSITR
jgi:hypothetical protein